VFVVRESLAAFVSREEDYQGRWEAWWWMSYSGL
jgi:hypothetical protein